MARPAVQSGHLEDRHAQSHIRQPVLLRILTCAHSSFRHRRITLHCSIWPRFSMVTTCPVLTKYLCDAQLEKYQKYVFFELFIFDCECSLTLGNILSLLKGMSGIPVHHSVQLYPCDSLADSDRDWSGFSLSG